MTTNIRACNKSGRPAVEFCISGKNVFIITKITAPVTIAILYRGGSKAVADSYLATDGIGSGNMIESAM